MVIALTVTSNWTAAFFCKVSPKVRLKKCEAYFFKGQKEAAFQLRSPPAVEAKAINLKR